PHLLRPAFEALRQVVVIDVANVALVDPHAERDRGDDDAALRPHEPRLDARPVVAVEPGVIRARGKAFVREAPRDLLGRSLQRHVDERRPGRPVAKTREEESVALTRRDGRREKREVRAVEARSNDTVRRDAELAPDVILDLDGRRRRQSEHALGAAGSGERCELEVIGPQGVTPLRDAMNLIDGEERHALIEERLSETLVQEALRRDVEDAKAVLAKAGVDLSGL